MFQCAAAVITSLMICIVYAANLRHVPSAYRAKFWHVALLSAGLLMLLLRVSRDIIASMDTAYRWHTWVTLAGLTTINLGLAVLSVSLGFERARERYKRKSP